jgi:hypothetical protein
MATRIAVLPPVTEEIVFVAMKITYYKFDVKIGR